MASKNALLGGAQIKVENMSGFDKSRFNAFTAPLGSIVPMAKQLLLPGNFNLRVKLSAQLPPLAADAFLRSHLKVEAFVIPLRQCYGGFMSWYSGEQITTATHPAGTAPLTVAQLPRIHFNPAFVDSGGTSHAISQTHIDSYFGPHTLMDYFGVKWPLVNGHCDITRWPYNVQGDYDLYFNAFPALAYQLCYHHWYRNKMVQRPLFAPPDMDASVGFAAGFAPFVSASSIRDFSFDLTGSVGGLTTTQTSRLLNGHLLQLRQRNYGFDYFTTALPTAFSGGVIQVSTSGNVFTIGALRTANNLAHFEDINQLASPDYVAVNKARYGRAPSAVVAQRPILVGSADFPMFTSGVEQTAQDTPASPNGNPFAGIAARYGRAHAEGSDFVCEVSVDEPSYLMVMCSLVPEANYASGIAHDMEIFTKAGSLTDLPVATLEGQGADPVFARELYFPTTQWSAVFGHQPKFMWHKAGAVNEVHGLFRKGASLEAFIPQRDFDSANTPPAQISDAFLQVAPTDLDNITAVSGAISQYGVMIDSSIELYVSEPLSEGVLPSLADPAAEHGSSVYVKRGGKSTI